MFPFRAKSRSTPKKKPRREILRKVLLSSGFKLVQLPLEVKTLFGKTERDCVTRTLDPR